MAKVDAKHDFILFLNYYYTLELRKATDQLSKYVELFTVPTFQSYLLFIKLYYNSLQLYMAFFGPNLRDICTLYIIKKLLSFCLPIRMRRKTAKTLIFTTT